MFIIHGVWFCVKVNFADFSKFFLATILLPGCDALRRGERVKLRRTGQGHGEAGEMGGETLCNF